MTGTKQSQQARSKKKLIGLVQTGSKQSEQAYSKLCEIQDMRLFVGRGSHCRGLRGLAEAVRVTVEVVRMLLEAVRVITKAIRKIIQWAAML